MFRVIIRNAVSNWLGFVVQAVITFLLTPFVLKALGASQYGAWMLVVGLTGYYGLLDLGFRSGLAQYITRHLANRDYGKMNATASTGVVVLGACGILIFLAGLGLALAAPWLFHLPAGGEAEIRWAILINAAAVALQFPLFPFSAVFAAKQRYDLANLIGTATRVGTAAATFVCLDAGYGLVGLSAVVAAGNWLDYALRWAVAYRILPELRISFGLADRRSAWEFMSFGIWNVLIAGSAQLAFYSSAVLIGLFLTTRDIAPYAVATGLITYFCNLFIPLGMVFFPVVTQLDAQNKPEELRRVYLFGARLLALLALPVGLLCAFWAEPFFRVWLGNGLSAEDYRTVNGVFYLLLGAAVLNAGQRVSYQILLGSRRVQRLAGLFAGEAFINLTLAVSLIPWLGVYGVALGVLLPAVVFQGLLHPRAACRLLGLSVSAYYRAAWPRPLAVAALLAPALYLIRCAGPVTGWGALVFQGALGGCAALLLTAGLGLDRDERQRLLLDPLKRFASRLRPAGRPAALTPLAIPFEPRAGSPAGKAP